MLTSSGSIRMITQGTCTLAKAFLSNTVSTKTIGMQLIFSFLYYYYYPRVISEHNQSSVQHGQGGTLRGTHRSELIKIGFFYLSGVQAFMNTFMTSPHC